MGVQMCMTGFCCSQDERKNSLKAYITNLRLTGVDGIADLDSEECGTQYKNSFEAAYNLRLTKDGMVKLYDDLMRNFAALQSIDQNAHAKVNVKVSEAGIGISRRLPCVL